MALTSLAVQAGRVEEACQRLWQEWLMLFFDGQAHAVSGRQEVFPAITGVRFGLPALEQGRNVIWVTVFSEAQRGREWLNDDEDGADLQFDGVPSVRDAAEPIGWRVVVQASVVRSEVTGPNAGNADYLARRVADLIRGLVRDPATSLLLAQRGICQVQLVGAAVAPATHFATVELRLRGEALYGTGETEEVPTAGRDVEEGETRVTEEGQEREMD